MKDRTALIIDNDQIHNKGIATAIKDLFSVIYTITNPYDAFYLFQEKTIDVVFMEFYLSTIDGIELLKMINENSPASIIIVWGANLDTDTKQKVRSSGVRDIIEKPFNIKELREKIMDYLPNQKGEKNE